MARAEAVLEHSAKLSRAKPSGPSPGMQFKSGNLMECLQLWYAPEKWYGGKSFGFGCGGVALQTPPPKRSFLAFDQGGQTGPPRSNAFFFGAADDTGAADDRQTSDDTDVPGQLFSHTMFREHPLNF